MPVKYGKRNRLWRILEESGQLVRNRNGTPVDGGGHASEAQARRQAGAINSRGNSNGGGASGKWSTERGASGEWLDPPTVSLGRRG